MKNLSDIVNVSINIEEPLVDSTSFDHMLIIGPEPKSWAKLTDEEREAKESVYICSSVSEISEADALGAETNEFNGDPIGIAGRVAFSQDPKPDKVYFAVNKKSAPTIKNISVRRETNRDITGGLTPPVLCISYDVDDNTASRKTEMLFTTVEFADIEPVIAKEGNHVEMYYPLDTFDLAGLDLIVSAILMDKVYQSDNKFEDEMLSYTESTITFEIKPGGTVTEDSVTVSTVTSPESIERTLDKALLTNGWYVVCPAYTDKATIERIGSWVDSQTKMCAFPVFDIPAEGEIPVCDKSLRCFGLFAKQNISQELDDVPVDNKYIHVAWVAKCLNYQAGSETWALKTLVGIQPATLNSTQMRKLEEFKLSYYTTCADRDITCGGMTTYGEWIDVIRFRDWLQNDMQKSIFDLLLRNPKIPYTDKGISLVKNVMIASLKRGQKNGGISEVEYDEDGNENPGFIVSVPLAANITPSQKKSRKLDNCKFSARLAGAIHAVDVNGALVYSNLGGNA